MKKYGSANATSVLIDTPTISKALLPFALFCLLLLAQFNAGAQNAKAHAFFSLVNFGHKTQYQISAEEKATVFYAGDTLSGHAELKGNAIFLTLSNDTLQRMLKLADSNFKEMQLYTNGSVVSFVRKGNDAKLFRLLFNDEGLKIYDDVLSSKIETGNINYSELLFEFDGKTYPAASFWTTSTKRSMIKILNNIFRLSLQPDEFKNKEAVMAAVLNYDNRIFPSTK